MLLGINFKPFALGDSVWIILWLLLHERSTADNLSIQRTLLIMMSDDGGGDCGDDVDHEDYLRWQTLQALNRRRVRQRQPRRQLCHNKGIMIRGVGVRLANFAVNRPIFARRLKIRLAAC